MEITSILYTEFIAFEYSGAYVLSQCRNFIH